jgi:3-phenylpropionate/trans-cinnamate dioxygenase ferredoxin subunit
MSWIKALALTEIAVGQTRAVTLQDEELLLCRVSESEIYAIENLCSHDDGPLTEGALTDRMIECPRHGARFDVTTGAVNRLPAASPLLTFATRINSGWVEVALGSSTDDPPQHAGEEA